MRYNVAQLMRESVGATRQYEVDEEVRNLEEGWGTLRVSGSVQMLKTQRGILVRASLHTDVPEECSRCLEAFREALALDIEEEFFPVTDVTTGLPLELPEEDEPFTISGHHILDLREAVRQAILLARPIQPLCREECAGLCPECGQKLDGQHDCVAERIDPRWEQLKQRFG